MFNFLTNLGWNFDAEREIFTPEEVIDRFDVNDINPKPAALPYAKLEWLNGVYIRNLTPTALQLRLAPYLSKQLGIAEAELRQSQQLAQLVPLIQERIKLLSEAAELVDWAFIGADEIGYPDPSLFTAKKLTLDQVLAVLDAGASLIAASEFSVPQLEAAFRAKADEMGIKVGPFLTPFRVALTGKTVAPPLFESMMVLGRRETLQRIHNAAQVLRKAVLQPV
jgi:glutamyl-tRNA synthetase